MSGEPKSKRFKGNFNKKQNFFKNSTNKGHFLEVGVRGFLATTNFREKECIRECHNILEQYADELYGPMGTNEDESNKHQKIAAESLNEQNELILAATKKDTEKNDDDKDKNNEDDADDVDDDDQADNEEDIATKLEKELTASVAAAKSNQKRFQTIQTEVSNCVFIKTTLTKPVELAVKLLNDVADTRKQITRNVLRFLPIETVCKANLVDIKNAAGILFDKHFLNSTPKSFSIIYNKRYNNSIQRDLIIRELAEMILQKNMAHKVDLKNGELSVIVEVIKGLCCLSVVPRYMQMRRYNLTELAASGCISSTSAPTTETTIDDNDDKSKINDAKVNSPNETDNKKEET